MIFRHRKRASEANTFSTFSSPTLLIRGSATRYSCFRYPCQICSFVPQQEAPLAPHGMDFSFDICCTPTTSCSGRKLSIYSLKTTTRIETQTRSLAPQVRCEPGEKDDNQPFQSHPHKTQITHKARSLKYKLPPSNSPPIRRPLQRISVIPIEIHHRPE